MLLKMLRNLSTLLCGAEIVQKHARLLCMAYQLHGLDQTSSRQVENGIFVRSVSAHGSSFIPLKVYCRHFSSDQKITISELVKDEKWVPVYRFGGIRLAVLLARAKLLQTLFAIGIVPFFYEKYALGELPLEQFLGIVGVGILAVSMLFFATRYFNRLIGVISMTESNKFLRVGYLTFWGSRRNRVISLDDVVPLIETDSNVRDVVLKFTQYSNPKFLYISTLKANIVDEDRAELIFGSLSVFREFSAKTQ